MSWLLERLHQHRDNRGLMANLRCVLVANKKHRAWPALHRLGVSADKERLAFIAGLFATHPEDSDKAGNFGRTCEAIQKKRGENNKEAKLTPTERRFQHLLAAEKSELPNRVLRMVLMAKSQNVPVNYKQLETDMKFWNDRTKNEWAAAFWTSGAQSNEKESI